MSSLTPILVLTVFVTLFGTVLVFATSLVGPKRKWTKAKLMAYESGLPGQEMKDTKISIKFYLTAILFIMFDLEIVFMYPWAISYGDFLDDGLGLYALIAMGIFAGLFIFGLFWEIKSKALEWE